MIFAFAEILVVLVHQQPGEGRDRVRRRAGSVRDRDPEIGVLRQLGTGGRGGDGFERGCHEAARRVLDLPVAQAVRQRVDQLDVAERALGLLHLLGHAFVALAAEPDGPAHRRGEAHLVPPLAGELVEEVGKDIGRARPVGAVHHDDVHGGQLHAGVERRDPLVVPAGDAAHEDLHQHVPVELEPGLTQRRKVVGHDHGAEHGRQMQHVAVDGGDLRLVHRPVGGAEVHRALGELADAAAGADGLVVDLHAGLLVVGVEPLRIDRIGERGAGPVQGLGSERCRRAAALR